MCKGTCVPLYADVSVRVHAHAQVCANAVCSSTWECGCVQMCTRLCLGIRTCVRGGEGQEESRADQRVLLPTELAYGQPWEVRAVGPAAGCFSEAGMQRGHGDLPVSTQQMAQVMGASRSRMRPAPPPHSQQLPLQPAHPTPGPQRRLLLNMGCLLLLSQEQGDFLPVLQAG